MTSFCQPILLSAAVITITATLIAAFAARVRFSASRGLRWALDILFLLPLALPSQFPIPIDQNIFLFEAFVTLPLLYLCAIMGFRNVRRETLDAARLQGMGPCGTFWRFFVPPARGWLLGGAALLLARMVVEAIVIVANTPRQVP